MGDDKLRKEISKKADDIKLAFQEDKSKRQQVLKKRLDFFAGEQESYTTIVGKDKKSKKGHANGVYNYVGKAAEKIAFNLCNNPPTMTTPGRTMVTEQNRETERLRATSVQNFEAEVMRRNLFWKKAYVRGCFNQVIMGDAAIKCYPIMVNGEWEIKITSQEKMDNIIVAWRGDDPFEFDGVVTEELRTIQSVEDEYGIKIPEKLSSTKEMQDQVKALKATQNWASGDMWGGKKDSEEDGKNELPTIVQTEYDCKDYYMIKIGEEIIEFVVKDDKTFPKVKFWTFVRNIPRPRSSWSKSDIENMMDPQLEFNEASNEERDYIRVGAAQKFVAYNMPDFDPKSMKTGSGGVVFVDSADGSSKFEPLQTNVNVFPIDSYLNRIQNVIFDMGIPKVAFGSSGSDSGRSKTIDYQSMVDLVSFKRGRWELALNELSEKIQQYGYFFFGRPDIAGGNSVSFFTDPDTEEFVVRYADYDWDDVMPITKSDVIVNVLNKFQMGLPFRYVFKELGYTDPSAVIAEMRKELKDPELMEMRSKMWQLTGGILAATQRAQALVQSQETPPPVTTAPGAPDVNQPAPTMIPSQSQNRQPMSQPGTTASYATPGGLMARTQQNNAAKGA